MPWYSANLIMYSMFKDGLQDRFPIREDVVLIDAPDVATAFEKAKKYGFDREGDEGGQYQFETRPATWIFVGVRKLIECDGCELVPKDGTEVSYSFHEVQDRASVQRLAKGEPITILYKD